jgi:cysteine desulfurase
LEPVVYGGGQEHGLRAGTENVAFAVALGAAADLAHTSLDNELPRRTGLRDRLRRALNTAQPGAVHLNGHPDQRLPNTLNISITGISGSSLLAAVPEIAASTGSACHAGTADPSPVLSAMGLDRDRALGAIRPSLGRWSATADVDRVAALLAAAATNLRHGAERVRTD